MRKIVVLLLSLGFAATAFGQTSSARRRVTKQPANVQAATAQPASKPQLSISDMAAIAEARTAYNNRDCAGADTALSAVSDNARNSNDYLSLAEQVAECKKDFARAIDLLNRMAVLPGADTASLATKIGQLRYQSKQREAEDAVNNEKRAYLQRYLGTWRYHEDVSRQFTNVSGTCTAEFYMDAQLTLTQIASQRFYGSDDLVAQGDIVLTARPRILYPNPDQHCSGSMDAIGRYHVNLRCQWNKGTGDDNTLCWVGGDRYDSQGSGTDGLPEKIYCGGLKIRGSQLNNGRTDKVFHFFYVWDERPRQWRVNAPCDFDLVR